MRFQQSLSKSVAASVAALVACTVLSPFVFASSISHAARPFVVVLDPGHGGNDEGAHVQIGPSQWLTEKEVTLAVAREVGQLLSARGVRVALTRTTDVDVPLSERTAVANRLKANVFLSMHMNSSQEINSGAEGVETYILNNSSDQSSKRLADLENAVLQDSRAAQFMKASASGDVALIVKDLMLDANLKESERLACSVQNRLVSTTSTPSTRYRNRGVKQALFYVLLGADMPSALVEMGFLNNPRDRQITTSALSQKRVAAAIAQAILDFRVHSAVGRCKVGEHPLSARKTVQTASASSKNQ